MNRPWRLAPNQEDLYLADQLLDTPGGYHSIRVYRADGPVDSAAMGAALDRLVADNPILASCIEAHDEGWYFHPSQFGPRLHITRTPVPADSAAARRRVLRECLRPFDLTSGPLLRAVLLHYPEGTADLVVVAHHVVADERSMEVALSRLTGDSGYAPAPGRPAPVFADWAESSRKASVYSTERIPRIREVLSAGSLDARPDWGAGEAAFGAAGLHAEFDVSAETWDAVGALAASLDVTPFSVLTAATGLVLARNMLVASPVVGVSVSRRPPPYFHTVGYFNTTVLVTVDVDDGLPLPEFIRRVHQNSLGAYRDAHIPLSAILDGRAGEPGVAAASGPHVVIARHATRRVIRAGGVTYRPLPDIDPGSAQFPLTLYAHDDDTARGLHGHLRAQRGWFHPQVAERFPRQVAAALAGLATAPSSAWLRDIATLDHREVTVIAETSRGRSAAAPRPLTAAGSRSSADGPRSPGEGDASSRPARTIPELFAVQATRDPGRPALTADGVTLTYGELDARSHELARALAAGGVAAGGRVGVHLERGAALVVALLAVLKTGAAYVPLDPRQPAERLAQVIDDTEPDVVISRDPIPVGTHTPKVLSPDTGSVADVAGPDPAGPDADAPAYLIHTSGSTGRPKGVVVTHRNLAALLDATQGEFGLRPDDVWTFFHSFAFDFSVWEIWGCLLTGGRLVVVPHWTARDPERFHRLLAEEGVTVLNQTPSAFAALRAADAASGAPLALRLLVFGGEALNPRPLLDWFDRHPEDRCRVVNMYGITETTVHCTWHTVTRADALRGSRVVGRPLPGWEVYVADERGRLTAPGVAGELWVGGAGVARGYWRRPGLTEERFRSEGIADVPGRRLYRSGDLGRYLPDGTLEHLGRLDDQVKIRGYRIEPDEIRQVLLEDPGVTAAAVLVDRPDGPDDAATARLDAYVVTRDDFSGADIRRRAARRLPDYMVPARVVNVGSIPLTGNGKLDTAALRLIAAREPADVPEPSAPPAAPAPVPSATDTERDMLRLWHQVLGTEVGPEDGFFENGGNSLLALRLNIALREAGYEGLRLRDLFRNSTPRRLARFVEGRLVRGEGSRP